MLRNILVLVLALALCHAAPHNEHLAGQSSTFHAQAQIQGLIRNKTSGLESVVSGTVDFFQDRPETLMRIKVNISFEPEFDLNDNVPRGFHIHTFAVSNNTGNPTIDCGTTGPHWNPENVTHGLLNSNIHHVGDLGNVLTSNGKIKTEYDQVHFTLSGKNSLIGHSIVLHERLDDGGLGTDPTSKTAGNSGARIACGTIKLKEF